MARNVEDVLDQLRHAALSLSRGSDRRPSFGSKGSSLQLLSRTSLAYRPEEEEDFPSTSPSTPRTVRISGSEETTPRSPHRSKENIMKGRRDGERGKGKRRMAPPRKALPTPPGTDSASDGGEKAGGVLGRRGYGKKPKEPFVVEMLPRQDTITLEISSLLEDLRKLAEAEYTDEEEANKSSVEESDTGWRTALSPTLGRNTLAVPHPALRRNRSKTLPFNTSSPTLEMGTYRSRSPSPARIRPTPPADLELPCAEGLAEKQRLRKSVSHEDSLAQQDCAADDHSRAQVDLLSRNKPHPSISRMSKLGKRETIQLLGDMTTILEGTLTTPSLIFSHSLCVRFLLFTYN